MSGSARPGVSSGAAVALLVLNVAGVPGLIRSTETGHPYGRAIGYGLAVAVGAASSALARTPWPFLGAVGMCVLMRYLQDGAAGAGTVGAAAVDTSDRPKRGVR